MVKTVPGAVDVAVEQQVDIPFLTVELNRAAIARYGLQRPASSAEAIETAFVGLRRSRRVLEGETTFDLVVRYDPDSAPTWRPSATTLITTPTGARVPLHALADIREDRGPNTISRENVQRKIVVMANVAGRDLHGVVDDIRRRDRPTRCRCRAATTSTTAGSSRAPSRPRAPSCSWAWP